MEGEEEKLASASLLVIPQKKRERERPFRQKRAQTEKGLDDGLGGSLSLSLSLGVGVEGRRKDLIGDMGDFSL